MSTSQMSIEQQLQVWHNNTPVWHHFPATDQNGVYFLGWGQEDIDKIGQSEDQPGGAIVVFNARRKTVRAYRRNERNERRVSRLGIGEFGYVLVDNSSRMAYVDGAPRGAQIPDHNVLLYCKGGTVICNRGVWGFLSAEMNAPRVETEWFTSVYEQMRRESFEIIVWGQNVMRFAPNYKPLTLTPKLQYVNMTIEGDAPNELTILPPSPRDEEFDAFDLWGEVDRVESVNWFGLTPDQISPVNLEQIPFDAVCQSDPDPIFTFTQYGELYNQMVYWQDRFNSAWDAGQYDDCEYCSLFTASVRALMNL